MPFKQQLMEDMKAAMRSHESVKLNTIRFLLSDIKNAEIDKGELTDAQMLEIVRKQVKQMEEANIQYQQGGRDDLIAENDTKVALLRAYLPPMMTDAELAAIVTTTIKDNPGQGMGPLIGLVRKATDGRADGGAVSAEIKRQLGV